MRIVVFVLACVLAIGVALFSAQNTQTVSVRFFSYASEATPLALVIICAAMSGGLLVWLAGLWGALRRRLQIRKLSQERSRLESRARELEQQLSRGAQERPQTRAG